MTPRTRTLLLTSAVPALWLAGLAASSAAAVDISSGTTTPVATSTAGAGGVADDVNILSGGSITLDNGTAITVDSNNSVDVGRGATITITDSNGATGIRVIGGFSGTITNDGTILIDDSTVRTDDDGDGTPDGPYAQGFGRTGILIEGAATHTGDVRNNSAGTITIEGNDSVGISLQANLNGSFINQGVIAVRGDNALGIDIGGNVTGDVRLTRTVGVIGENATAVRVAGDIGGGLSNSGTISATGFAFTNVSNYFDPDTVDDGFEPLPLDGEDLLNGGPALAIGGSIAEGVLNNGPVGGGDADDDADGNDAVKDITGDFDVNRSSGSITVFGSAPAVLISPDFAPVAAGDTIIGLVVENVRDTLDDDGDDDTDEIIATFLSAHGFVNRGTIASNGLNVGFESAAIVIRGSMDGTRSTTIAGGILNAGSISSTAFEADATAITIGTGASIPNFDNEGIVLASINTETDHNVTLLIIEAGAMVSALDNSGRFSATAVGDAANVVAIRDLSGTLLSINNTGNILAIHALDNDDDDGDGATDDTDEVTGVEIAIDLSTHTAGQNVTLVQDFETPTLDTNNDGVIDTDDVAAPSIRGDILLGAGDDEFQLLAGIATGDLAFGDGVDSFTIDGGATFTGGLTDTDGQLTINVADGTLNLTETGDLAVTDLTLANDATATFAIDLRSGSTTNTRIVASNGISIAGGAALFPQIVGFGSESTTLVEILRADGGIVLADGQDLATNLSVTSPFLFETSIAEGTDAGADIITVSIRRRSAEELGMNDAQAVAYNPVVAALNGDDELLLAIANIAEAEDFFTAYEQLLPEYAVAALQFAVANVDGAIGAVGNRLDVVRGGRESAGGVWMQEFGVFIDRDNGPNGGAYRGQGFGIAGGVDRPLGPFYAVGLNFVGSASQIEQPGGFDQPMSVSSAQLGAYAAAEINGFLIDVYAGGGMDFFDTERQIVVVDPITEAVVIRNAVADWSGSHANASARIAYDLQSGRFFARPALSVDYMMLNEDGYDETGDPSILLSIADRESDIFSTTASLTLGATFGSQLRSWWSPRVRLGYRSESGSAALTSARFLGGTERFELDAGDLPDSGGIFGFTFAAGSRYSSFAFDYDADVRDGFIRHGARVAFRFVF